MSRGRPDPRPARDRTRWLLGGNDGTEDFACISDAESPPVAVRRALQRGSAGRRGGGLRRRGRVLGDGQPCWSRILILRATRAPISAGSLRRCRPELTSQPRLAGLRRPRRRRCFLSSGAGGAGADRARRSATLDAGRRLTRRRPPRAAASSLSKNRRQARRGGRRHRRGGDARESTGWPPGSPGARTPSTRAERRGGKAVLESINLRGSTGRRPAGGGAGRSAEGRGRHRAVGRPPAKTVVHRSAPSAPRPLPTSKTRSTASGR